MLRPEDLGVRKAQRVLEDHSCLRGPCGNDVLTLSIENRLGSIDYWSEQGDGEVFQIAHPAVVARRAYNRCDKFYGARGIVEGAAPKTLHANPRGIKQTDEPERPNVLSGAGEPPQKMQRLAIE